MKSARISELKNRLSHYLRYVRRGQTVLVLDRDRAIARIEPVRESTVLHGDAATVADLERTGAMRAPTATLPSGWLEQRPTAAADLLHALLAEREFGR
ncbi:MAG: hypothetical protein AB1762_05720 [Gemmatimonadota bacterium]